MLMWLINNSEVGDRYDNGDGCSGTITFKEYQGAVWTIIDDNNGSGSRSTEGRMECIVQGIAADAVSTGGNYEPDCLDAEKRLVSYSLLMRL